MYRNRNVIATAAAVGALTAAAPAAAETPIAASLEPLRPLTEEPFEPLRPLPEPASRATAEAPAGRAELRLERDYRTLHRRAERRDLEPGRHIADDGVRSGRQVRDARPRELRTSIGELRQMLREKTPGPGVSPAGGNSSASPQLAAIAACESGGDPSRVGGGGMYRGKYQFSRETWASVGGSGDPASASESEQDRRAAALIAQQGTSAWPNCG